MDAQVQIDGIAIFDMT